METLETTSNIKLDNFVEEVEHFKETKHASTEEVIKFLEEFQDLENEGVNLTEEFGAEKATEIFEVLNHVLSTAMERLDEKYNKTIDNIKKITESK